jgi:hypothetical protein
LADERFDVRDSDWLWLIRGGLDGR